MWPLKEEWKISSLYNLITLHLNCDYESWNVNFQDLQLLTGQDNSWVDSIVEILCGVESADNRTTYLMYSTPSNGTTLEFIWWITPYVISLEALDSPP